MSVLRRLVPTVAALAVVALTMSLGNWQVRRAQEKIQMQAQRDAAELLQPAIVPARPLGDPELAALEGGRASVTGEWLGESSVYIDNRTYKGLAGFHVVTPIRIMGSAERGGEALHLLVLRGWVARDLHDRTRLPAVPAAAGPVTVTGIVQAELAQAMELATPAPPGPGQRLWQNLTVDGFRDWSGLALQPMLIRQTEPAIGPGGSIDDGLVRDWPQPGLDVDRHRGYAFQWYSLAAATAALWLWFVVLKPWRQRGRAADLEN
jgi:cytochrome oxidase assembly protein ShyY1